MTNLASDCGFEEEDRARKIQNDQYALNGQFLRVMVETEKLLCMLWNQQKTRNARNEPDFVTNGAADFESVWREYAADGVLPMLERAHSKSSLGSANGGVEP